MLWTLAALFLLTAEYTKPPSNSDNATGSKPKQVQLGQWKASAIADNAVTGSVFYVLPAVVAVSSVLLPISILIARLLLYPFRLIICELASALSASNAGNYSYLANISSKLVAVLAAAITLLDDIATGAHIDYRLISVLLLVGLAALSLLGLCDSSTVLIVAGVIAWIRNGNSLLHENWNIGMSAILAPSTGKGDCTRHL